MSSFPSLYQFKLLRHLVVIPLIPPMIAFCMVIWTIPATINYIGAIRKTNRLQNEGKITTVPLLGHPPRYIENRKQWACKVVMPDGTIDEYYRDEEPANGVTKLYFMEHSEITGSLANPRWEGGIRAMRQVVVEVPAKPGWTDIFKGLTDGSFTARTGFLLLRVVVTFLSFWLAWQSYWWIKGGRRRSRHRRRDY